MSALKIGVFDLMSFFWTLAGARSKEEGAQGLALAVLRYMRAAAERAQLDAVTFGADGPGPSFRARHCAAYKGDRKAKDSEQRGELNALFGALVDAGFPVVQEVEGGSLAAGDVRWFEGDDGCAALAVKVAAGGHEAHVASNDWDLAQVLALGYALDGRILLRTTRGEERTAADVEWEFGVPAAKLGELKALAGDSDGYKPFPGEKPGSPGIGDKTAAALLKHFGSAKAALAAALSNLDEEFKKAGLPPRVPRLLRAGGAEALSMGLSCALLRTDVPVPESVDVGDWEEAEELLRMREVKLTEAEGLLAAEEREAEATAARAKLQVTRDREVAGAGLCGAEDDPRRVRGASPEVLALIEAEPRLRMHDASKSTADDFRRMSREHFAERPPIAESMLGPAEGLPVSRGGAPRIGEYDGGDAVRDVFGRRRDPKGAGMYEDPLDRVERLESEEIERDGFGLKRLPSDLNGSRLAFAKEIEGNVERMESRHPVIGSEPIPMLLWCPACHERHVDAGDFVEKSHHTHSCQKCGMVWRPAVACTVGVQFLPGFKDAPGAE
jgi:5'-3' exonuclease